MDLQHFGGKKKGNQFQTVFDHNNMISNEIVTSNMPENV